MQFVRVMTRNQETSQRIIGMTKPFSNISVSSIICKESAQSNVVQKSLTSLAPQATLHLSVLPVSSLLVPVRYAHKGKGKPGKGEAEKYNEDITSTLPINNTGIEEELNISSMNTDVSFEHLVEATQNSVLDCKYKCLHKMLSYPLTNIPLALATSKNEMRQGNKSAFRNYLIEESGAVNIGDIPTVAEWVVDGMATVRLVYPLESWGEFAEYFLHLCIPPPSLKPLKLIIVMDTYGENYIKVINCRNKSKRSERIQIYSDQQKMPSKIEWDDFLANNENKTELIRFLVEYYKKADIYPRLKIPLIITEAENSWLIESNNVNFLETCNHYEADTKTILYASKSIDPVVVVAKDTDILILLVYVYSVLKPRAVWWMRIDSERYVNIKRLCDYYGEDVCNILPAFHSITGCDTTSYPYRVGKLKPFKKMIKENRVNLLSTFGKSKSFSDLTNARKFFQCVMYPGKESESIVETRVNMYKKQKVKLSLTLIPDPQSAEEHLKRADYQTYIWHQCINQNINYPSVVGRGWMMTQDGDVEVVWFDGCQVLS